MEYKRHGCARETDLLTEKVETYKMDLVVLQETTFPWCRKLPTHTGNPGDQVWFKGTFINITVGCGRHVNISHLSVVDGSSDHHLILFDFIKP